MPRARARVPGPLAAGLADGFDLVQVGGLDAAAVPLPRVAVADAAAAAVGVGGDLRRGGRVRYLAGGLQGERGQRTFTSGATCGSD